MPVLYYAKVNVSSKIFDVYEGKTTIQKIMNMVFEKLDDKAEYTKIEHRIIHEDGELVEIEFSETYNFSGVEKFSDEPNKYVIGTLVRRYPLHGERFDEKTRQSKRVVYEDNSMSIMFYFDAISEIIVFSVRQKFGYRQFMVGFRGLLDGMIEGVGFEIFLISDPFTIKERLERAHKINRIVSVIVPPNANEEAIDDLYDISVDKMQSGRITKMTNIFEAHAKMKTGMNLDSDIVRQALETNEAFYERGYGRLEVEGENRDGSTFKFDSDADAPYQTFIDEPEKNIMEKFLDACRSGVSALLAKQTVNKYADK